jgi:hypothetical protein
MTTKTNPLAVMYALRKRGKYMEGHSYATGIGYRFHWTRDITKARRFNPEIEGCYWSFAQITGAEGVELPAALAAFEVTP